MSVPTTHLNHKRAPHHAAMISCYLRGICWFRLLRGAVGETGDMLEFRLQLGCSFGSDLLSRQYRMDCRGIRTRNVLIIPAYHRRRTAHDAITWSLAGRYRSGVCVENGGQAVEHSSSGQLSTCAGSL